MGAAEHILKSNRDFTVISVYPKDLAALVSEIERSQPDVIIMDEYTNFIEPLHLFTSLHKIPNVRLIVLNNHKIHVNIYDKHERDIADPSQLVNAIGLDHGIFHIE